MVVSGSAAFSYQLLDRALPLTPGASGEARVVASAAADAPKGATGRLSLTASTESARLAPATAMADIAIADHRGLDVSITPKEAVTDYGVPVFYTIVITNTGSAAERAKISTSQEITKFINVLEPHQPTVNLAAGEVVSRTLIVTPRRLITDGFIKNLSGKIAKRQRMNDYDLALFRIVTDAMDATQVIVSNKDITATAVVTTTSRPFSAKKAQQQRRNEPYDNLPSPKRSTMPGAAAQQDQGISGWLLGVFRNLASATTDFVGRTIAWIGATSAVASPFDAPSYAGGTPHDTNRTTCAYCHEVHGAREGAASTGGSKLLMAWSPNRYNSGDTSTVVRPLCDTCHNGSGSKYNVEAGTVTVSGTVTDTLGGAFKDPALGTSSPITVGETFSYTTYPALMSSTVDFVPSNPITNSVVATATIATSSTHGVEVNMSPPYAITNTLSPNYVAPDNFVCTSCHDQHGTTSNPRLIRQTITFGGISSAVNFNWTYQTSTLPELVTPTSGSTDLCYACHNDKDALRHAGGHGGSTYYFPITMTTNSQQTGTWDIFSGNGGGTTPTNKYPTEYDPASGLYRVMVCLTCHKAHGTTLAPDYGGVVPLGREELYAWQQQYGNYCSICHGLF